MPRRSIRAFIAMSALAAVIAGNGLGAAGPAFASVSGRAAHLATPECLVLPTCVSLYQFSPVKSRHLVLEATGVFGDAPVILRAEDAVDLNQDWTYIDLGTVGRYRTEGVRNAFGLSGFDFANYGSDELYQLELSPAGLPSGFCAANVANRLVLRTCNGSRFQTVISANHVRRAWTSPFSYFYGLSVVQASVAAHHLSLTGSRSSDARVTFSRPATSSTQFWQPS